MTDPQPPPPNTDHDLADQPQPTRTPRWVVSVVLLTMLLTAVGGLIAQLDPTLLTARQPVTDATDVYARYTAARDLALAAALLTALTLRARPALAALLALTGLIQITDITEDLSSGRILLVPGLLILATATLLAATRLARPTSQRDPTSRHKRTLVGSRGRLGLWPQSRRPWAR